MTDFTVTPYDVRGTIDYEKLLEQFGADQLTDEQINRFPSPVHPLLRRRQFYAHRDIDRFCDAIEAKQTHSIVTGRGPSGAMHLGHIIPLYFAKYVQEQTNARVYIPFSDDEKFLVKDRTLETIGEQTRDNLKELLAVGFDPERTRIIIDTHDADVIYPLAVAFGESITQSTFNSTYGEPKNIGHSFYPAVQTAHLLLPQLIHGAHPTLVPIGIDQDPHVRVSRDVASKRRFPVEKPTALLSKFLPRLDGPGKMSASGDAHATITLADDRETIATKIHTHAVTGGQASKAAHRKHGGDPTADVPFQLLQAMFEPDDERLARIEHDYRSGKLLSGELKAIAIDAIAEFLAAHQQRKTQLGPLKTELSQYRLSDTERTTARKRVGHYELKSMN